MISGVENYLFLLGKNVGCKDLLDAIGQRPSLKAIIFGHVHHSYGAIERDGKLFINAAQYNGIYQNDRRNEPYEISMRGHDKSIVSVHPIPTKTNTTTKNSTTENTNELVSHTPVDENDQADKKCTLG